jgi:tetratricopeptide (TPR) repeat protein
MSHGSYPRPSSPPPRTCARRTVRGGCSLACMVLACALPGCERPDPPVQARVDVPASAAAIETYLREGLPDEAMRVADRLRELEPTSALAAELQARALLMAATHDAERGHDPLPRRRLALERYREACAMAPREAGLWRSQGVAADMVGDAERAIECYEAAAILDPSSMQDRLLLGLAHLRRREFDEARQALDDARRLAPDSPWPLSAQASLSAELGAFSEAIASARQAVAMAPDEAGLAVNLAKVLRQAGSPGQAIDGLMALPPEQRLQRGATEELALSLIDLGRVTDAARAWNDFALASPGDAAAATEAGRLWLRAGDRTRARACVDLARVAQPGSTLADELQRMLDESVRAPTAP